MTQPDAAPSDTPSSDASARAGAGRSRPELEEDLAALARLRDAALELALAIAAQAKATAAAESCAGEPDEAPSASIPAHIPGPVPPKGDPVLAFSRASRAVRMTCNLRAKLIGEIDRLEDVQRRRADGRDAQARYERKDQIARLLTTIIHDEAQAAPDSDDAPETEGEIGEAEGVENERAEGEIDVRRLVAEANERLNDREVYGDVLDRPVSAFIDQVCRDLGLAPDWRRLAEQAWAREEIASGRVGAPLAAALAEPFSSPARAGGGPRSGGGGASRQSAPSVTARKRRATFPASGAGEEIAPPPTPTFEPPRPSPPPEPIPPPPPPPPPRELSPRERAEAELDLAHAAALPGELPPLRGRFSAPFAPP